MTQKEKELLLTDLCTRLPYGVMCDRLGHPKKLLAVSPYKKFQLEFDNGEYIPSDYELEDIKPYLRPMSSMTEEEKKEYGKVCELDTEILSKHPMDETPFPALYNSQDWLNEHHFDYRGLISMGLALKASEGMYEK